MLSKVEKDMKISKFTQIDMQTSRPCSLSAKKTIMKPAVSGDSEEPLGRVQLRRLIDHMLDIAA